MENEKEVFELLVGKHRPSEAHAEAAAELLKLAIDSDQGPLAANRVASILLQIRGATQIGTATLFRAVFLTWFDQESIKSICNEVRINITGARSDPYKIGYLMGLVETGAWSNTKGHTADCVRDEICKQLCDFLFNVECRLALDKEVSGRLSNISGAFIFGIGRKRFFAEIVNASKKCDWNEPETSADIQVLRELIHRTFKSCSLLEQIKILALLP